MDLLQNKEAADKMFGANIMIGIGGGGILAPIGAVISLILPRFKLQQ